MRSLAPLSAALLLVPAALLVPRSEAAPAGALPRLPVAEAATQGPVSGTFQVDPVHSSLVFHVRHADASRFWGRFNSFSGSLTVDAEKPEQSSVVVEVQAESVDTANQGRDQHLRGPDFFNAKEFPVVVFESTKVAGSEKGFRVTGELTLLGVTKEVTTQAEFVGYSESERFKKRTGYEVRFKIRRSEFGMNYMVGPMLGDEVELIFSLQGMAE